MPSRLDELSEFVMLVSRKKHQVTWLDLLAVVEAARNLAGAAYSADDCMSTVHMDYVDLLEIALTKLDEVQP